MKTGDGASYLQLKVPSKGRIREGFWNFLEKYGYRFSDGFTRTLLPVEVPISLCVCNELCELLL